MPLLSHDVKGAGWKWKRHALAGPSEVSTYLPDLGTNVSKGSTMQDILDMVVVFAAFARCHKTLKYRYMNEIHLLWATPYDSKHVAKCLRLESWHAYQNHLYLNHESKIHGSYFRSPAAAYSLLLLAILTSA